MVMDSLEIVLTELWKERDHSWQTETAPIHHHFISKHLGKHKSKEYLFTVTCLKHYLWTENIEYKDNIHIQHPVMVFLYFYVCFFMP